MPIWLGGQDEVVFEGRSFALDAAGAVVGRAPGFEEKMVFTQVDKAPSAIALIADVLPERSMEADLWDALVLGVRDYVRKNGFPGVLLACRGIDSALVLAIAVDALGAARVRTVMMPLALHGRHQLDRCARHGRAAGRAVRRNRHCADVRRLAGRAGPHFVGAQRGHDRGKPAGAHSRHLADGVVQQVPGRWC